MKSKKPVNMFLIKRIIQLVCVVIFVFSAVSIVRYYIMTENTKKNQMALLEVYNGEVSTQSPAPQSAEPAPVNTLMPVKVVFTEPPQAPKRASIHDKATMVPKKQEARNAKVTPEPAMGDKFISLYRINNDVKGWLKLNSVYSVNFPVVHKDNEFYLNHDFYTKKNAGGTAFLDAECSILPKSDNLIIHGHNMKNGTMFGKLYTLLNPELMKREPFAYFDTLYEQGIYVPYAIGVVSLKPSDASYAPIYETKFSGDDDKGYYIRELRNISAFNFPIEVSTDDELLTLITCHGGNNEERLVVAYRKLRENENENELKQHIAKNLRLSGKK